MKIKCPKCGKETSFKLNEAIDEEGEVFICNHCKWPFRYTKKIR